MIVSPYYKWTGRNCKLNFRYRIMGYPGTELLVTVQLKVRITSWVSSKSL